MTLTNFNLDVIFIVYRERIKVVGLVSAEISIRNQRHFLVNDNKQQPSQQAIFVSPHRQKISTQLFSYLEKHLNLAIKVSLLKNPEFQKQANILSATLGRPGKGNKGSKYLH